MDIRHRIGVQAPVAAVFDALTTAGGLAAWWTEETTGTGEVGGTIHFRFADRGFFEMRVVEREPGRRVLWEVADGPAEWVGTHIAFDLRQEDDYAIVLFRHSGWREAVEFMHHCSTKWATFLLSLKSLVETGAGAPFPADVKIDNWN